MTLDPAAFKAICGLVNPTNIEFLKLS